MSLGCDCFAEVLDKSGHRRPMARIPLPDRRHDAPDISIQNDLRCANAACLTLTK